MHEKLSTLLPVLTIVFGTSAILLFIMAYYLRLPIRNAKKQYKELMKKIEKAEAMNDDEAANELHIALDDIREKMIANSHIVWYAILMLVLCVLCLIGSLVI